MVPGFGGHDGQIQACAATRTRDTQLYTRAQPSKTWHTRLQRNYKLSVALASEPWGCRNGAVNVTGVGAWGGRVKAAHGLISDCPSAYVSHTRRHKRTRTRRHETLYKLTKNTRI